jgi:hypothetical protein
LVIGGGIFFLYQNFGFRPPTTNQINQNYTEILIFHKTKFKYIILIFFVKNIIWVMVRFLKVGSVLHSIPPLPNIGTTNFKEESREET